MAQIKYFFCKTHSKILRNQAAAVAHQLKVAGMCTIEKRYDSVR